MLDVNLLAAIVNIDTELNNDNAAGSVLFSTSLGAAIDATTAGIEDLVIDTTSGGGADGNIQLSDIGVNARLGNFSATAGDGTIFTNDTDGDTSPKSSLRMHRSRSAVRPC